MAGCSVLSQLSICVRFADLPPHRTLRCAPNGATIYDAGQHGEHLFIAMEPLPGRLFAGKCRKVRWRVEKRCGKPVKSRRLLLPHTRPESQVERPNLYELTTPAFSQCFILRVRRHRLGERSYWRVLTAALLVRMWTSMPGSWMRPSTNFARARPTLFAM